MGRLPQFTSSVNFVTGFLFINLKHTKTYDLTDLFKFLNSDPNSNCLNLNLNDQKTSHFYWCIPAMLETYMMPIYVALQAGIEFKEKQRVPFRKYGGLKIWYFRIIKLKTKIIYRRLNLSNLFTFLLEYLKKKVCQIEENDSTYLQVKRSYGKNTWTDSSKGPKQQ